MDDGTGLEDMGVRAKAFICALYESAQKNLQDAEELAAASLSLVAEAKAKMALAEDVGRLSAIDGPMAEAILDSELGDVAYSVHVEDGGAGL
jgi:hypothetical protein